MHPIIWAEVLHFNGSPPLRQKMKWPAEYSLACPEHITYAEMHTHSIGIIVMHCWKRWHGYWGKQTHITQLLHIFIIHTILKLSKSKFLFFFHAWIKNALKNNVYNRIISLHYHHWCYQKLSEWQHTISPFIPYSVLTLASDWLRTMKYRHVFNIWRHQLDI